MEERLEHILNLLPRAVLNVAEGLTRPFHLSVRLLDHSFRDHSSASEILQVLRLKGLFLQVDLEAKLFDLVA